MLRSYTKPNLVMSYHRIRQAIGWLGLGLPFILLIGNYCINHLDILNNENLVNTNCNFYISNGSFKSSISHYYYSTVGELFTGTLCAVALFMFCYRGYPKRDEELVPSDSFMTNLAGICTLGVVVFPTTYNNCISDNTRTFVSSQLIGYIHYTFAAFFFISLTLISLVNFRRTAKLEDFGKMPSHNFYKYCGIVMLTCIFLIAFYSFVLEDNFPWLEDYPITFILETISLIAFSASWLKKGDIDSN